MIKYIIGVDEVGTGSAVERLVVCGVKASPEWTLDCLNDSKKLSLSKRKSARDLILKEDISFYIAERSNIEIDELGLAKALKDAYLEVFKNLYNEDCKIICDGNIKFEKDNYNRENLIKADTKISTVMAASILAKTYRDDILCNLSKDFPEYGFETNAGYLSKKHKEAIQKYGLTSFHRKSYNIKL